MSKLIAMHAIKPAICFLCKLMEKKTPDIYKTNKHGKKSAIKRACYAETDRYLARQRANIYHTESICDLDKREPSVSFDDENQEQDHTAADAIIEKN